MQIWDDIDPEFISAQTKLLCDSFQHFVGRPLVETTNTEQTLIECLFNAPFVVVSHGLEHDPILNYGNATALALWEMTWAELTATPSRLTAEPSNQEARASAMAQVKKVGYTEGYSAVRISKSGRRFEIKNTVIWNLNNEEGLYKGQAATFADWSFL